MMMDITSQDGRGQREGHMGKQREGREDVTQAEITNVKKMKEINEPT
jgi:hypothetical protein